MLLFSFACPNEKSNEKKRTKAVLDTFKSIRYFESRNLPASCTEPRRSHCQEISYILKSVSFYVQMNASPLGSFRKICRADCREWTSVKKITLSERSELGIFRKGMSVRKEPDSLSGSKPFRELFRFLFGGTKRKERSQECLLLLAITQQYFSLNDL